MKKGKKIMSFNTLIENTVIPVKYRKIIQGFYEDYLKSVPPENKKSCLALFKTFITLIESQIKNPCVFSHYHERVKTPFNYYQFGLDFLRPLVDFPNSKVLGLEHIEQMISYLKKGDNIIFFANHQSESDPLAINLLLEKKHPQFAEEIIFVAGQRVLTDLLAVPFSMGYNLLCIYSKRYMDQENPEERRKKQLHNHKTMQIMGELLATGGKSIYVAPSGGRDRMNDKGIIEVAPFDAQSIEMFILMAKKAKKNTHFYPLSLATYNLLPPPKTIEQELGEMRKTQKSAIHLAFGKQIDLKIFSSILDKTVKRKEQSDYIYSEVVKNYQKITECL
jgi:glycerol-3-phosphate O-acyltransferase